MKDKDRAILEKMIGRLSNIIRYCNGCSYEEFEKNTMLAEACVFNILQIGELSKKALSDDFKETYDFIPWRQINGMRNRIVYGYEGVTLNIVWDTINEDLPELKEKLAKILKEL